MPLDMVGTDPDPLGYEYACPCPCPCPTLAVASATLEFDVAKPFRSFSRSSPGIGGKGEFEVVRGYAAFPFGVVGVAVALA